MNCRRTRELLSPYSDGRLTGAQMLEVAQHMDHCQGCRAEYQVIQDVKVLLRAVARPQPEGALEYEIRKRIATEEAISQINLCLSFSVRPQRAKRMATAMALSCFSVLVVAAPFGAGTLALSYTRQAEKHASAVIAGHGASPELAELSAPPSVSLFTSGPPLSNIGGGAQPRRRDDSFDNFSFGMSRTASYGSFASQQYSGAGDGPPFSVPAHR